MPRLPFLMHKWCYSILWLHLPFWVSQKNEPLLNHLRIPGLVSFAEGPARGNGVGDIAQPGLPSGRLGAEIKYLAILIDNSYQLTIQENNTSPCRANQPISQLPPTIRHHPLQ